MKRRSANHRKINKWQYFSRVGEIASLIARLSICRRVGQGVSERCERRSARSHGSPWIKASEAWREGRWRLVSGGGAGALCLSGGRVGGLHANLRDRGNFPIEMRSRCLSVSVASLRPPFSVSFSLLTRTWASAYHPPPPRDEGEEHEHHGKGWLSLGWVT